MTSWVCPRKWATLRTASPRAVAGWPRNEHALDHPAAVCRVRTAAASPTAARSRPVPVVRGPAQFAPDQLADVPGQVQDEVPDAVQVGPRPPPDLLVGQLAEAVLDPAQGLPELVRQFPPHQGGQVVCHLVASLGSPGHALGERYSSRDGEPAVPRRCPPRTTPRTEAALDIRNYNRHAWDRQVAAGNRWTVPVGPEVTAAARRGLWQIVLTPTKPVPRGWFGDLAGAGVLCLASGGGQQGPVLAAAGARVTVFDNSPAQLARDREVAARDGLTLETVEGDMRDLSAFADGSFDLIVHPCSNGFVPDVRPVWRECYRVLRPGGALLAGFANPVLYCFDDAAATDRGELVMRHPIPYSDLASLTDDERRRYTDRDEPLCFGHTLGDQIGGQLAAGLVLAGFYEDRDPKHPLARYIDTFAATRAFKPGAGWGTR